MDKGIVVFSDCKLLQEFHRQFTFQSVCDMIDLDKPFSGLDVAVVDQHTLSDDHIKDYPTPRVYFEYLKKVRVCLFDYCLEVCMQCTYMCCLF